MDSLSKTRTWHDNKYSQNVYIDSITEQSFLVVQREKQVNVNYNQYIQDKIKNKLRMKAINHACFKLEEKVTRSVKNNIHVVLEEEN